MTTQLNQVAKQIGNTIIDLSDALNESMEKRSDEDKHPNGTEATECVGFITKETADPRLNFVVDIYAPIDKSEAKLRTWGIETTSDDKQNERFNNIQLDFDVNYAQARTLGQKGGDATRDDIRTLLNDQNTQLKRVIVSNLSGRDEASGQILGKRYDLIVGETDDQEDNIDKIINALNAVLPALQTSAATQ